MTAGSEGPWPSFASSACASKEYVKQLDKETLVVCECVSSWLLLNHRQQPIQTVTTHYRQIHVSTSLLPIKKCLNGWDRSLKREAMCIQVWISHNDGHLAACKKYFRAFQPHFYHVSCACHAQDTHWHISLCWWKNGFFKNELLTKISLFINSTDASIYKWNYNSVSHLLFSPTAEENLQYINVV